jgi:hypothetical protein
MYYINLGIFFAGIVLVYLGMLRIYAKTISAVDRIVNKTSWSATFTIDLWLLSFGSVAVLHSLIQLLR